MSKSLPSTSFIERFVLSFYVSKNSHVYKLFDILSAISLVSVSATPIKTHSPFLMLPVIFPSIVHFAWFTRCITNLIIMFSSLNPLFTCYKSDIIIWLQFILACDFTSIFSNNNHNILNHIYQINKSGHDISAWHSC